MPAAERAIMSTGRRTTVIPTTCDPSSIRTTQVQWSHFAPTERNDGEVTLDVGREDRHTRRRPLLGHQLQRLGLAGAGRTADESMPVHHGQRNPHLRLSSQRAVDNQCSELDTRAVEG